MAHASPRRARHRYFTRFSDGRLGAGGSVGGGGSAGGSAPGRDGAPGLGPSVRAVPLRAATPVLPARRGPRGAAAAESALVASPASPLLPLVVDTGSLAPPRRPCVPAR